ncbi:MAG: hypothetical protein WBI14_02530 [Anaerolineaceae bacterium]
MNIWTESSIAYANQRSYLDDLFQVYNTTPDGIRNITQEFENDVSQAFEARDNEKLIKVLLKAKLFPIKDPYVAFFKHDPSAIERNLQTINRIAGSLYSLGLAKIIERSTEPKEMNRQIGPMFRRWLLNKSLGILPVSLSEFLANENNAILDSTDKMARTFAKEHLNYSRNKGIDFVARFNKKYIIGEAKFITDDGGHQNNQFLDALELIQDTRVKAIRIAILDGVLYIPSKRKIYKEISDPYNDFPIMSALVLRDFLYQV